METLGKHNKRRTMRRKIMRNIEENEDNKENEDEKENEEGCGQ